MLQSEGCCVCVRVCMNLCGWWLAGWNMAAFSWLLLTPVWAPTDSPSPLHLSEGAASAPVATEHTAVSKTHICICVTVYVESAWESYRKQRHGLLDGQRYILPSVDADRLHGERCHLSSSSSNRHCYCIRSDESNRDEADQVWSRWSCRWLDANGHIVITTIKSN